MTKPKDPSEKSDPLLIHATLITVEGRGVLIKGPSGSGKSDLALRLITCQFAPYLCETQPKLVADDQVQLIIRDGRLFGSAPANLQGLLEVRQLGIETVPFAKQSMVNLCVSLTPEKDIERLPSNPAAIEIINTIELPSILLDPHQLSAPQKLLMALKNIAKKDSKT